MRQLTIYGDTQTLEFVRTAGGTVFEAIAGESLELRIKFRDGLAASAFAATDTFKLVAKDDKGDEDFILQSTDISSAWTDLASGYVAFTIDCDTVEFAAMFASDDSDRTVWVEITRTTLAGATDILIQDNGVAKQAIDEGTEGVPVYATRLKHAYDQTAAPTATDDAGEGYAQGSIWLDTTNNLTYLCTDPTTDAAVWDQIPGIPEALGDLSDVDLSGLVDNNIIRYDAASGTWKCEAPVETLAALTDVNLASLADGNIIKYDNATSKWVVAIPVESIAALTDVNLASLTDGNYLRYDSGTSKWIVATPVETVAALLDVDVSAIADGNYLQYDSGTGKWVAGVFDPEFNGPSIITGTDPAKPALIVKTAAGQSVNGFELQDSSGDVLFYVTSGGNLNVPGTIGSGSYMTGTRGIFPWVFGSPTSDFKIGGRYQGSDSAQKNVIIEGRSAWAGATVNLNGGDLKIRAGQHATAGGVQGRIILQDADLNTLLEVSQDEGATVPELASTPTTPAAGFVKIYPKTDGMYWLDDAGVEHSLGSGSAVSETITQATHGFSAGDVLYHNGTIYAKAKADAAATAEAVGVVEESTGTNTFTIIYSGRITGLSGLTAGTVYFLSDATAGELTATEPTTLTTISKPLLIATSTTSGVVVNMRGSVNTAADSSENNDVYAVCWDTTGDIYCSKDGESPFWPVGYNLGQGGACCVAPNGDVYVADTDESGGVGDIHIRTGGTGAFSALSQTYRHWYGIDPAPNGDIWACVNAGYIYKRTAGAGDFVAVTSTARAWVDITVDANGHVWGAVRSGDIYKSTDGSTFVAQSIGALNYNGISANPVTGDIYYTIQNDGIYKLVAGSGPPVEVEGSNVYWYGVECASDGTTIYASVYQVGLYRSLSGMDFASIHPSTLNWRDIACRRYSE